MKKNKGITLVTLVVTIIIITIILGISVNVGYNLLEKSDAGKMITYMELVEARADAVYEDILFDSVDKEEFKNNISVNEIIETENYNELKEKETNKSLTTDEEALLESIKEIDNIIENFNIYYIYTRWNSDMLAKNGIEKNILGSDEEYFIVAYDYNTQRVVGVYYNKGCSIDGVKYYSLEDLRENLNK